MRKLVLRTALAGLTLGALSSNLRAETIEELKAMIQALDQKVKVLERKQELEKETAVEKEKSASVVSVGANGFVIRSADTNFVMRLRAVVQADGRFYPNNGNGTAKDTFTMRKVRPYLEGTVYGKFDYRLMTDFGSGLTSTTANNDFVQDAYVNARLWPEFQIQAGKFKEPVGLERLKSDADVSFTERAYPTSLVPNRDVGLMFQGEIAKGIAAYQLGIFNGTTDGGSDDAETSDGDKDVAARVFFKPFLNSKTEGLRGFGFGVAGTAGRQKGAPRAYSTPGQQRFFSYLSGAGTSAATANVNADGTHLRLVPQASYYWGPFGIYGEYAISDQELSRSAGGPLTYTRVQNTGWQVTGSYFLTDDQNSFGQIVPKKPVDFSGNGGWGAWEVVAKVSGIDLDKKAFPLFASSATSACSALTWGIGLNWYLNRNVKLQAGYERTDFEGGKGSILNAKGENVLLTRIQLAF